MTYFEIWLIIILVVILAAIVFCISGCMVIWTDDVFIATAFKTVDANDIALVADPNGTKIGSGVSKTQNDKIKAITPYGVLETE